MRYVEAAGARLSVIGLGTWRFGSSGWGYGAAHAERTTGDIIARALELGVTLFDTAEVYGGGESERLLGHAIAARRDRVFVATKLYPTFPVASVTVRHARRSARRLGIDRIDLYQLHGANPVVPLSSTMRGMARLQTAGLVRHVGISNMGVDAWRAAEQALGGPVLANQVRYSLAIRAPEADLLPWVQATSDRVLIAHSPLAQGLLAGNFDADHPPTDRRATGPLFTAEAMERARPLLAALRDVAVGRGVAPATVALAWLVRRPGVVAIPGARTVAQLEANVAAASLDLTDAEDAALTAASDAAALVFPRGGLLARVLRR